MARACPLRTAGAAMRPSTAREGSDVHLATGQPEDHPTPLPLNSAGLPGVAPATPGFPPGSEQGGVRDLTGERLSQLAAGEADAAAAMAAGMAAEAGRRQHYES